MKTEDIERSLFGYLEEGLADELSDARLGLDKPGNRFSPERFAEWFEPRIQTFDREALSRGARGTSQAETRGTVGLQVRCFTKTQEKGKRFGDLSRLVDKVRLLVDYEEGARTAPIRDNDGEQIGQFEFAQAQEARQHAVTVAINGVDVLGVDLSTLTIPVRISSRFC